MTLIALVLLSILLFAPTVAMQLIFWFKKNTIVEYGELLRLNKLLKLDDFRRMTENDELMSYPKFLWLEKDCFVTRLISCPVCFGTWLTCFQIVPFYATICIWFKTLLPLTLMFPHIAATAYAGLYLYFKLGKMMTND